MIKTILIILGIVTALHSSGIERRQKVFNKTISELLDKNECFFNNQLIDQFNHNLESNKLGVRKNIIQYKMQMDKFLSAFKYQKVWRYEFETKYKICIKEETYRNIHIPNQTIQITNLTLPFTFEQYPYLKDHLSHIKITKMLSHLPYNLKCLMKMVRYTIYQNKIYLQTYPAQKFIWNLMDKIIEDLETQLPNVDFIIYSRSQIHQRFIFEQFDNDFGNNQALFDGNVELTKKIIIELPAFMMSKDLNGSLEFNKLLIVDCEIAQFPWKDALKDIQLGEEKYSWKNKIQKGFWRGDPTGKPYDYTDYWSDIPMYFPRLNLVDISQKNFDYLDAKFTLQQDIPLYKIKAHNISVAVQNLPPIHQQLRYKYLLNVDGWSANWLTLPWMLASNSVVLKQQTLKVQWFYDEIKPNIHYIPLQYNFSNIFSQITLLRQNDQLALTISNNAQQYIKQNLMPSNIKQKLSKILQEYAEVQNLQLALYWKISIKYKNHLRHLKKAIILLLVVVLFWRLYLVFPKVKFFLQNSFIWKGINEYFAEQKLGYNQVAQQ